jgi:signal transduction histidine kinase
MLSEFVRSHRDEIIARCRTRVADRMAPRPTPSELEHGIPLFLGELEHTLACELGNQPPPVTGAVQHGGDLLRSGFTVAQVVHDYGDACQTITELAIERSAPISTEDFRALNKCLDNAIAEAVTEYERQREIDVVAEDARRSNQHLGFIAHELRNTLSSALLAFDVLRAGSVGIRGSTGDVLGRSLIGLRDLVDRSLTEVRLTAGIAREERVTVARFVEDIEVSALLSAKARGLKLTVAEVDPELIVETDRQILASIVSNLLQNAFKYTRPHSHVWLHTHATADRVLFDIEDQCGGIPPGKSEQLFEPFVQQSDDRTGLGLGLAICVRGVKALRGAIRVRNQNKGCVFTVELPRGAGSSLVRA